MRQAALTGLLLAACAHGPAPTGPDPAVATAEALGEAIAEQDRISAAATDMAGDSGELEKATALFGWITLKQGSHWEVDFVRKDQRGELAVAVRVRFEPVGPDLRAEVEAVDDLPLEGDARAMFLARQAVLQHHLPYCTRTVNPVVLPGALRGLDGWLVYLLPGQTEIGKLPLSVQRYRVSADGATVLESEALTRGCPVLEYGPNAIPVIEHVISSTPMEHHAWASRVMKVPLFIGVDSTAWKATDGKLTLVKKR